MFKSDISNLFIIYGNPHTNSGHCPDIVFWYLGEYRMQYSTRYFSTVCFFLGTCGIITYVMTNNVVQFERDIVNRCEITKAPKKCLKFLSRQDIQFIWLCINESKYLSSILSGKMMQVGKVKCPYLLFVLWPFWKTESVEHTFQNVRHTHLLNIECSLVVIE